MDGDNLGGTRDVPLLGASARVEPRRMSSLPIPPSKSRDGRR